MSDITEKCYNSLLNDISPDVGRDTIPKHYYSIGEVAEKLKVPNTLLRFWEKEFNLKPNRNRIGRRRYSVKDLQSIEQIYRLLKIELYTIKGAKRQLKIQDDKNKRWNKVFKSKKS